MFTGLVKEVGVVAAVTHGADGVRLEVQAGLSSSAAIGDSVAVNGVCLTVVAAGGGTLAFDAVPETLARSSLGMLGPGSRVNLEPALRAGDPLGGHYVQGHVDGVGRVLLRYVVEKGSIAVEGTSLTVAGVDGGGFAVALIPHTLAATTLGGLSAGDAVNLEVDVLAKYVEKLLPR